MSDLIASVSTINWPAVIAVVVAFNALLMAFSALLDKVKDITATDLDNKASVILHNTSNFLSKVIDIVTGNKEHKSDAEKQ